MHKNKPPPNELPMWYRTITLKGEKPDPKELKEPKPVKFRYPLSDLRVAAEQQRKVALECSRRCLYSKQDYEEMTLIAESKGEPAPKPDTVLNYQEQICIVRCINKYMEAKDICDHKTKG